MTPPLHNLWPFDAKNDLRLLPCSLRVAVGFDGVAVRLFRVLMGCGGMLVGYVMIALFVMFRGGVVGFRGVLVMLCCLAVRFVCHDRHLLFGSPQTTGAHARLRIVSRVSRQSELTARKETANSQQ